jgi:hypothetical protein
MSNGLRGITVVTISLGRDQAGGDGASDGVTQTGSGAIYRRYIYRTCSPLIQMFSLSLGAKANEDDAEEVNGTE